jgi:transposase-like protein
MTDPTLDRQVRHRMAVLRHAEEVTGNVSMTCRYFGITRQTYYKWRRRFEELGADGLLDRSRGRSRARTRPRSTSSARSCICGRTTTSAQRRSPCI